MSVTFFALFVILLIDIFKLYFYVISCIMRCEFIKYYIHCKVFSHILLFLFDFPVYSDQLIFPCTFFNLLLYSFFSLHCSLHTANSA